MAQTEDPRTGQLVDGGSGRVRPLSGTGGIVRARTITTINQGTATWLAGSNITNLEVFCWATTVNAPAANALVGLVGLLVIDAVDGAQALAWLGGTANYVTSLVENRGGNVNFIPIPLLEWATIPLESAMTNGPSGGGRVDVRSADAATALNWIIRGS